MIILCNFGTCSCLINTSLKRLSSSNACSQRKPGVYSEVKTAFPGARGHCQAGDALPDLCPFIFEYIKSIGIKC